MDRRMPPVIDVGIDNVAETGFFCYMSKPKSAGYQHKHDWLGSRFQEGLRIRMIRDGGRGFIEYIPGEYAWRPVNAERYMFIHCIWIVGQTKGRGHGRLLLEHCLKDARKAGLDGVAMVTSEETWLVGKDFLLNNGFQSVDNAPPSFELLVKKFRDSPSPTFTGQWDRKMKRLGKGLTIVRSDQCPYIEASVNMMRATAKEHGIPSRVVELRSAEDVRKITPSAYGVFSVVLNGRLVSYHPMGKTGFLQALENAGKTGA